MAGISFQVYGRKLNIQFVDGSLALIEIWPDTDLYVYWYHSYWVQQGEKTSKNGKKCYFSDKSCELDRDI